MLWMQMHQDEPFMHITQHAQKVVFSLTARLADSSFGGLALNVCLHYANCLLRTVCWAVCMGSEYVWADCVEGERYVCLIQSGLGWLYGVRHMYDYTGMLG